MKLKTGDLVYISFPHYSTRAGGKILDEWEFGIVIRNLVDGNTYDVYHITKEKTIAYMKEYLRLV